MRPRPEPLLAVADLSGLGPGLWPAWTSRSWAWTQPWLADGTALRLAGLVCAIKPGAAASKIPTMIVFTERMFLLIPFTVYLPSRVSQHGSRVSGLGEESGCCKYSRH